MRDTSSTICKRRARTGPRIAGSLQPIASNVMGFIRESANFTRQENLTSVGCEQSWPKSIRAQLACL